MADGTFDLFEQLSVNPNNIIYTIVFKACASLPNERSIRIGKELLDQISNTLPMDNVLSNTAVHMLMRFRDIQGAERIFETTNKKNVITYGAMMQGNDPSYQLYSTELLFRLS